MYDVKRTVTGAEPVTVAEMKAFILNRYDETDQASLSQLDAVITAAREMAEQYCNRSFIVQEIELTDFVKGCWSDDVPEFVLPFPNHLAVVEVKVDDVATSDYTTVGLSRITVQFTSRYFTTGTTGTKFYIKYTAGECPGQGKNAIMQLAKEMYEDRGGMQGTIKDALTKFANGLNLLNSLIIY